MSTHWRNVLKIDRRKRGGTRGGAEKKGVDRWLKIINQYHYPSGGGNEEMENSDKGNLQL